MSQQLISRSPDLKKLRDEGYDIEVREPYLLIKNIPYVNSHKEVLFGTLVSELTLAGDVTTTPNTHVATFIGSHPCDRDGIEIRQIKHQSKDEKLASDLIINHSFSSKPPEGYKDYYEKMTTYTLIISSQAQSIDPTVSAQTYPPILTEEGESVFNYFDTATSRAGINLVTRKLEGRKISIIGLGGTGSYVLDLVAKTPVSEIHLFDGDKFLNHNAFRCPGAPSIDELRRNLSKVSYLHSQYSKMHRGIIAHEFYLESSNLNYLVGMDFVFLCLEAGEAKQTIIAKLEEIGIPFIDVGLGVDLVDGSLGGIIRITTSTSENRESLKKRISLSSANRNDDYSRNIQIADLNAINAALAVIKWKKLFGFYRDLEKEYNCTYTIDGNILNNDDYL